MREDSVSHNRTKFLSQDTSALRPVLFDWNTSVTDLEILMVQLSSMKLLIITKFYF